MHVARFLIRLLVLACAMGAGAAGASAQPAIAWLDPLVGVWDTEDAYYPVSGEPSVERGVRTCARVLRDVYLRCETVVARSHSRGRSYWFLANCNATQKRFEMLSLWSNVPHKAIQALAARERTLVGAGHRIARADRLDRSARRAWRRSGEVADVVSRDVDEAAVTLHTRQRTQALRGLAMKKMQVQGVHHITLVGSTKQSAIDFWQGALGMPFVMEQPNLGKPDENHLYFDPGDGRLLTVFTNESRDDARRHAPREIGCVEHIAFNVSRATFQLAPGRLRERGIDFIERDRGFMNSIYLHDPNGLKIELACYKFETPEGFLDVDVLMAAHHLRVARGDHHITEEHLADAIEQLLATRPRLAVEEPVKTPA